jgi:hypothetical protein
MDQKAPTRPWPGAREPERLAVCFPAWRAQTPARHRLPRLGDLVPRRWRRQVVIQGQRFWLPG